MFSSSYALRRQGIESARKRLEWTRGRDAQTASVHLNDASSTSYMC